MTDTPPPTTPASRRSGPSPAELAARVVELEGQLARLIDVVADKPATPQPDPAAPTTGEPGKSCEPGEDEPQPTLEEWVRDITDLYYLTAEVKGWEDNTAMRAELASLKLAHHHAFGPKAGPWDQLTWHDHLYRVIQRLGADPDTPKRRAERHSNLNRGS